jgi:DAK2 domain fusion protein YloV
MFDAEAVRRWCRAAVSALDEQRQDIDDLNVYPVPDGDTGTNLVLTMRSAAGAVERDRGARAGVGAVLQVMARGAVLGAHGNSGVILAQVLCGLADELAETDTGDGPSLIAALNRAADLAFSVVAEPVEGTMLTVVRAAADAAHGSGPGEVVTSALDAAEQALLRTTGQLAALTRAGVVDAGGRGFVVVLDALVGVLTGAAPRRFVSSGARGRAVLEAARETGSDHFAYEVQYLLHASPDAVQVLKQQLGGLGDSLVVVGTGDTLWNVHVHVDDVGAAVEAGVEAGRPHRITVVRFSDQIAAHPSGWARREVAIVAVAPHGLGDVLRAEGVVVVESDAETEALTGAVLGAIQASGAESIVLIPSAAHGKSSVEDAAGRARAAGVRVAVVPVRSPVQALAAVAVHDPLRRFDDDVISMAEAAAATRWAEVTVAVQESLTMAGRCQPGDVLGLIGGEVVVIGAGVNTVAAAVIDRLLAVGGELITVLLGLDAPPDVESALTRHLSDQPHVELAVFSGGQPVFPLLIGVE